MRAVDLSSTPHPDAPGAVSWASHAGQTVAEAGEAGVLARILPRTKGAETAIVPTGDDAAVVAAPDGRYVVTTDLMVEGPDFRRDWHDPRDLGWKACASNLADVAAMGARPTAAVIGLALPGDTPLAWVEAFGAGFAAGLAAMAPGAGIVGGDLSTSAHLVVSVTAFGDLEGRPPVLRSGARAGDVVALAGDAGRSASGLAALLGGTAGLGGTGSRSSAASGSAAHAGSGTDTLAHSLGADAHVDRALDAVLRAHFSPTPRIAAGPLAAAAGATAMLDVSDGLLLDASRLGRASGVVVDIDSAAFAGDAAALAVLRGRDGLPIGERAALERCLTGGEDHALLATFPAGAELPVPFRAIGRVVAAAATEPSAVRVDGEPREPVGWDPYAAH